MHNLIIAPHPDDEVLGCFSFLDKDAFVLYVTQYHPLFPDGENIHELYELAQRLDFDYEICTQYAMDTNSLDGVRTDKLVELFEARLLKKPHTVLIPNPSYNQDHRIVYDAALTAMRHHDRNYFVKRILLYEQPETWDTMRKPAPFQANYFRKIDVLKKIDAMMVYKSQLRGHRSCDYIKAIAEIRGQQANVDYAEAFEVVRWAE